MKAGRTVLSLVLVAALPWISSAEDEKCKRACDEFKCAAAKFKKTLDLADTVQASVSFSEDQKAMTALFRNLDVAVGGIKRGPLVDTRSATVLIPLQESSKAFCVQQDVRGDVDIDDGARAVLLIQSAGKSHLVNLSEAAAGDGAFTHSIEAKVPAKTCQYKVTFFLLVERDPDDPDTGARLAVDTLDIELRGG